MALRHPLRLRPPGPVDPLAALHRRPRLDRVGPAHDVLVRSDVEELGRARELNWEVETAFAPSTVVSKATLPATPKVLALPGR